MSSSTEAAVTQPGATAWHPPLDLTEKGLARFDPQRVEDAVRRGHESGHAAGYEDGYREGMAAALADASRTAEEAREAAQAEVRRMLGAIETGMLAARSREADQHQVFADAVVEAAMAIAAGVLDRELTDEAVRAADAARRVLAHLDREEHVEVRLHPDDLVLVSRDGLPAGVRLAADPALRPGDAVAVTEHRTVESRLAASLERALAVLEGRS